MTSSPTTATLKCCSVLRMYPATVNYQVWTQKLKISALGSCFNIISEKKTYRWIFGAAGKGHSAFLTTWVRVSAVKIDV